MRKAFIDGTGLLIAHGHMDSNNDDTPMDVPEDFDLEPLRWKLVAGEWVSVEGQA